ncbi:unnamed protein product [Phytophthora fragariaefolia]|uniref:Unnamed protein product n=1 Tax=Phytophthora fragariaefolia TaxID=1490495 RepID=A0A9W7DD17_9STRA|nr:unnamed protein product [Phytophthora fragariaefolia]
MNIYRVSDSNGLVIASRTTSTSNNKTYPLLSLISTDNPATFVAGISATAADLLQITWNDKPPAGFTSQAHRMCFDIGFTRPYKSGYPHTFGLVSSADVICISPSATTATPSGNGCLYLVADTINKMLFNTNTPYSSSYGTAPITMNAGNMYIKCSNALNDGTTNFDMPLYIESSNATAPIGFAFQISNDLRTTSTNAAYIGTKENIQKLDVGIERYKLLEPSSYNYKNQAGRTKIGLIAQDVIQVCGEALVFTDNENMKVDEEGDLEGIQLGLDYNAIGVLNTAIIKKLIAMVDDQQAQIDELRAIIAE